MRSMPGPLDHITFTHQTWDRIANIAAFSTRDTTAIGGEAGVPLGTIALAPARAASVTGDQLTLLLRLYPQRGDGPCQLLAKGADQYGLLQPDEAHLTFLLTTEKSHPLTVPLPDNWYDQWHDVAALYTGETMRLLIDGAPAGEVPAAGLIRYAPGALLLGIHPFDGTTGRGVVAALQIHEEALDTDALSTTWEKPGPTCRLDLRLHELSPFETPTPAPLVESPPLSTSWQDCLMACHPRGILLASDQLSLVVPDGADWNDIDVDWEVSADGESLQSGRCPLTWDQSSNRIAIALAYDLPDGAPGTEYWLNLFFLKSAAPVARKQFRLPVDTPARPGPPAAILPPIVIQEKENRGYFKGEDFEIEIDFPTATITSWKVDGEELLELGPIHQLWRAPTWDECLPDDNSEGTALVWSRAGLAENIMGVTAMEALQSMPSLVVLQFKGLIIRRNSDVLFEIERDYAIHGDGEVVLTQRLIPRTPMPRPGRIGLELRLPKDMNQVMWFGRGPAAPDVDSQVWDIVGRYEEAAPELYAEDGWPVERGYKSSVRWITLRNGAGRGLFLGSDVPFGATLSPYSAFQLSEACHDSTLTPDSAYTLHIDHKTEGVLPAAQTVITQLRMRPLLPEDTSPWNYLKTGAPQNDETPSNES